MRNQILVAVEVLDGELEASQRLEDRDLSDVKQIVPATPERGVRRGRRGKEGKGGHKLDWLPLGLLLEDEDEVTCGQVRLLVCLASEYERLVEARASLDLNLDDLLLLDRLLALAGVAAHAGRDDLALALALVADWSA